MRSNNVLRAGLTVTSLAILTLSFDGCKAKPAVDDATLNTTLQSRLQADPGLTGQPVQTTVENGVVTLSGKVGNESARSLAANDAAEVAGIRTVVNNLEVGTAATSSTPVRTARVEEPRRVVQPVQQQNPAPVDRRAPSYSEPPPPLTTSRQPSAPSFRNVTVPEGTGLAVRVTETLDSASTQPGTSFSGVLASDVLVDGLVAFPAGTRVTGHVDDAKDAGHFKGNSTLAISLSGISPHGGNIAISTDTFTKEGKGRGKNTAEKVGGGAAVGAILGGIFGGGKGAAIGAGAGGGLGAGANAITRGEQVQIPSESIVRFRLSSSVSVRASTQVPVDNPSDLRRRDQ